MVRFSVFFILILCALAAGSINRGRGHSYATGFLLGAILGPAGVVLAAITGKIEKPAEVYQAKINDLERQKEALEKLLKSYPGNSKDGNK